MATKKSPQLSPRQIQRAVLRRLAAYEKLSSLEQFVTFMGKVQILELGLKHMLARRYDYDFDRMERWTLGRVVRELKEKGLRGDVVALLESLVERRNFIAHELLVSGAQFRSIMGKRFRTPRFLARLLEHGIYELEQVIYLHDWTEEHKAWGQQPAQPAQPEP